MIVAVNGSVTPSVTRLRCVFAGTDGRGLRDLPARRGKLLELREIAARCAGVRFSAPPSESNVRATTLSAGASDLSACACSFWKRAACSSGSLLALLGFCRFCVSRTGFVTMSRIALFCQKQTAKAATSVAAEITSRRRSSERWSTRLSLSS